jgi:hypothetical protein
MMDRTVIEDEDTVQAWIWAHVLQKAFEKLHKGVAIVRSQLDVTEYDSVLSKCWEQRVPVI